MPRRTPPPGDDVACPDWFAGFLADRAIRKPSPHTAKAYRQDFTAIATLLGGDSVAMADLPLQSVTKDEIRQALATYADAHEPARTAAAPWPPTAYSTSRC